MTFRFLNEQVVALLVDQRPPAWLPVCFARVGDQLVEDVHRIEFTEVVSSKRPSRCDLSEIQMLVDRATEVWNIAVGSGYPIQLSTDEVLSGRLIEPNYSCLEALVGVFSFWRESSTFDDGPYIRLADYPTQLRNLDPHITVGNLSAAIGLALLDKLLARGIVDYTAENFEDFGMICEFALIARMNNYGERCCQCERRALVDGGYTVIPYASSSTKVH